MFDMPTGKLQDLERKLAGCDLKPARKRRVAHAPEHDSTNNIMFDSCLTNGLLKASTTIHNDNLL